jgi:hypothetical protein
MENVKLFWKKWDGGGKAGIVWEVFLPIKMCK